MEYLDGFFFAYVQNYGVYIFRDRKFQLWMKFSGNNKNSRKTIRINPILNHLVLSNKALSLTIILVQRKGNYSKSLDIEFDFGENLVYLIDHCVFGVNKIVCAFNNGMLRFYEYSMSKGKSQFLSKFNSYFENISQLKFCPRNQFLFVLSTFPDAQLFVYEILDHRKYSIVRKTQVREKARSFEFIQYNSQGLEFVLFKNSEVVVKEFNYTNRNINEILTKKIEKIYSQSQVCSIGREFVFVGKYSENLKTLKIYFN